MADAGSERLDQYLVRMGFVASRRAARELIAQRRVSVNGRTPRKGDVVRAGDRIEVEDRPLTLALLPDPEVAIEVLYLDEALLIVNKPGLMPCHPLKPGERRTLMNGVVARFPETATASALEREGGLVHRLDNGTSGAVMVARTGEAHVRLRRDLRAGTIGRTYHALVMGKLAQALELDEPIGHRRGSARRMGTLSTGSRLRGHPRAAATHVEPLRQAGRFTLISVTPSSGSRHQIRVHLASAGYPIVNDTLYRAPRIAALPEGRFWLHLSRLELESLAAGRIIVDAPLPADLSELLDHVPKIDS
jgi:23S rRNA pseudouridine1911/1915/1917 synthase